MLRFSDEHLDFLVGDLFPTLARLSEQPEHRPPGNVEQPDQGRGDDRQQTHHRRDLACDRLGRAQRDLLGHQFPDDEGRVGDECHHGPDPERARSTCGDASSHQPCGEPQAKRRAGESAGQDADERDADLNGGKEAAGVRSQLEGRRGAADIPLHHALETSRTGRDNCQFGHGKKAVHGNQNDDNRDFKQHKLQ